MMKEINCNIIRDILPLYVDDVVSDDTKKMVEEHLKNCEECSKEVELMKNEVYIPAEKEASIIKNFKKKWRNKKLIISGLSILLTGLILFGAFSFVFHFDRIIPYSESLIKIEEQDDMLVSHYYGKEYYSVKATEPIKVNIDGEEKNIILLYYTATIADSPSGKLINDKKERVEQNFIFQLGNKDTVDAVYYGDFDFSKIFKDGNNWAKVLENSQIIWEE